MKIWPQHNVSLLKTLSNFLPFGGTASSTRSLPIACVSRAATGTLCTALCGTSLLANFWVCGTNFERIGLVLSNVLGISKTNMWLRYFEEMTLIIGRTIKLLTMNAYPAHLTSFVLLRLWFGQFRVERCVLSSCSLVIGSAFAILRRFGVHTFSILRVFSRVAQHA